MTWDLPKAVVCHSSTKEQGHGSADVNTWGRGGGLQTLTIGSKRGLQVQVYDKGAEIQEASGKTWMVDLWRQQGYEPPKEGPIRDVWRLEVRFGGDWLKQRNIRTLAAFMENLPELLTEALYRNRLTVPSGDSNRARWPLHPLWAAALHGLPKGLDMVPLGRVVTRRRDALYERMARQVAGSVRSAVVLNLGGDWDEEEAELLMAEAIRIIRADKEHGRKVDRARERYRLVDEPA